MNYFKIMPNCSGFGFEIEKQKKTFLQSSYYKGYCKIESLGYEFDIFPDEDIVCGSREIYLVSKALRNTLLASDLTGFSINAAKFQYSLNFQFFHPDKQNLQYYWLKVHGLAGETDYGLTEKYELVISEIALNFLKQFRIETIGITQYEIGTKA